VREDAVLDMTWQTKVERASVLCGLVFFVCLFLYKVEFTALQSYDEAWYGEIARNVITAHNPFLLMFNGAVFTDHPPLGYWFMAVSTMVFGSTEWSVRVFSVACGVGTLLCIYWIGKNMCGWGGGLSAVAVLASSLWFVFRVRSGNLDIPVMFWEVLTIVLLLQKKPWTKYLALYSFSALMLTKTVVWFGLLPALLYLLWLKRKMLKWQLLVAHGLCCAALVLPWYIVNQLYDPRFFAHHFFEIGARGNENNFSLSALMQNLQYLAIGVGKWYKVFWVALGIGVLSSVRAWRLQVWRSQVILLFLWWCGFALFFFAKKTEIWHLLPLYPVLALAIPFFLLRGIQSSIKKNFVRHSLIGVTVAGCVVLAVFQYTQFANLFYPAQPVWSAERDIAIKARPYTQVALMETFYPAAVYYTQQRILPLHWDTQAYEKMVDGIQMQSPMVFIINAEKKKQLEVQGVPFVTLQQNEQYFLIGAPVSESPASQISL
jgi:4-amino-4-deoxy-L-arabinose transferase-like glycosyltransferase